MTIDRLKRKGQKAERSAREATFPKCKDCGNVLGVERAAAGIKRCRGCLPDAELADRDVLSKLKYNVAPNIQDPAVRECMLELIGVIARGNV